MLCPACETDNPIGTTYCAGCGARLVLTDIGAHDAALAEAVHDKWRRLFEAMNRTLFLLLLVFLGTLAFRAYATRTIIAQYSAVAPLPQRPPVVLTTTFLKQIALAAPVLAPAAPIPAEVGSEADVLVAFASVAREKLAVDVRLKDTSKSVQGTLLWRTADEVRVIDRSSPPRVVIVRTSDIDFARSRLPK